MSLPTLPKPTKDTLTNCHSSLLFFYKNIGKNHNWVDRLVWTEKQWIEYVSNSKVETYVLKAKGDFAGYFELILHLEANEVEIAYLGLLAEYQNKKLGSFILSAAIKNSFLKKPKRVWVHTCCLLYTSPSPRD